MPHFGPFVFTFSGLMTGGHDNFHYFALESLPLGDLSAIVFTSTAFAALFSWIIFKRTQTCSKIVLYVTVITGAVFVVRYRVPQA